MLQWGAGLGELYQQTQLTAELCLGQFPIWWGLSPCALGITQIARLVL